jgi:putative salt-induced outer membrane protein YdiY
MPAASVAVRRRRVPRTINVVPELACHTAMVDTRAFFSGAHSNASHARGLGHGRGRRTATTKVLDKFSDVSGTTNAQLKNFLGLDVKMSDKLALSAGLDVEHNSRAPTPKKSNDEMTTIAIVYAF